MRTVLAANRLAGEIFGHGGGGALLMADLDATGD